MGRMSWSSRGPGAHPPDVPVWVTVGWVVFWAVALLAPAVAGLDGTDHPALGALALAGVLVCFTASVLGTALRLRSARSWAPVVTTAQFGLTAALAGLPGLSWQTLPLLLATGVAVVAPLRWAPSLVGVVAVAAVVLGVGRGSPWASAVWGTGVTTVLAGLLTWALLWLSAVVRELHGTRLQLARNAVAAERLRFSRDLHDLLGHSLSVISVKAQAARRSLPADPSAAGRHASDIEELARDALAEVRQAVRGYRQTTLDAEVDRAAQALRAAGIETEVVRGEAALSPAQEDLLAWVVREGATNVLRHARAGRARIVTGTEGGTATVVVEDDGSGPDPDEDQSSVDGRAAHVTGSGLAGLRERLSRAGGTLATHGDAAGFRLTVHVPPAGDPTARDRSGRMPS